MKTTQTQTLLEFFCFALFCVCFLFFVFCFLVCYSGCGVRLQRLKAYLLYVAKGTPPWLLIYLERLKIIFVVVANLSDLR